MLSDVNRGNSCIWLHFSVDLVPVTTEKVRQSYSVKYCLESVEEYSECTIH